MSKYAIYLINILAVALPLAIFEIVVDRDGWGSTWSSGEWYAKPFAPDNRPLQAVFKLLGLQSPLVYHLVMFFGVIPVIFVGQYLFLTKNIALLLACFVGNMVVEDFLWFLINWNWDTLRQLLKGPNGKGW